mmetsp:Transcript_104650/g.180762  ORF Transcript_104650/g.180762 Transcript_104650/m.180762 type:complete len:762 (+) Transcript_104650:107-2392(+)
MTRLSASVVLALLLAAGAAASKSHEESLEAEWSKELQEPETKVVTYKNPVKRVVALLVKMKAELTAEAGKESEMYDKMVCWCETNDKEKTKAIADAEALMSSLESDIKAKAAKMGELETEIAATKKQIAADTDSLKTATAIREKEAAEFNAEEKDMLQVLTNLKNAIAILGKHHSAFLQLDSPIMASVRAVLQDVALKYDLLSGDHPQSARRGAQRPVAAFLALDAKQGITEQLLKTLGGDQEEGIPVNLAAHLLAESVKKSPTGSAFMQASAKAPGYESYSARSTTIFGILNQMKEEFEASMSQSQKDELKAQEDFQALSTTKAEQIAAAKEKLDVMETESAANSKALGDDKDDLAATSAQRSADVEFLRNLKLTCQDLDRKYEERTTTRAEEVKAVSEAIAVLTEDDAREHLAKTTSFLQERSSADSAARARRSRAMAFLWSKAREPSFADDLLAEWHKSRSPRSSARSTNSKLATLAVSVQLDSFTKVKKVMDELVADLKKEQADEVAFKADCVKHFDENEKAIYESTETKSDLEAKIDSLAKTMAKLAEEIAADKKAVAETELEIKKASQAREEENADFQVTIADQRATQDILLKALSKLEEFYGKALLIQSAAHSAQEPPVKFQTYTTNAGASPVMSLIQQIIGDSKALETEAVAGEEKSQADYETFVKDSNAVIASLTEAIASKTASSTQADEDSALAKSDLGTTEDELASLEERKANLHGECDWVMKNFEIRQKARLEEIDAILQAKYILSGKK